MINKEIATELKDMAIKTKNLLIVNDVLNKIEAVDEHIYASYRVDSYYIRQQDKKPTVSVRNVSPDLLKRVKALLEIKGRATKHSDEYTVDEVHETPTYFFKAQWDTDRLGCEIEYEETECEVDGAFINDEGKILKTVKRVKGVKCGTITKKIKEVFNGTS
tara:strand:- start:384 stop:866 length:483 start_codon:yes stop_codon:yes gene_type:complete